GGSVTGDHRLKVHEVEPWTKTLLLMSGWKERFWQEMKNAKSDSERQIAEERFYAVNEDLKSALETFLGEDCFGENHKPWQLMLDACTELQERYEERGRPKPTPG